MSARPFESTPCPMLWVRWGGWLTRVCGWRVAGSGGDPLELQRVQRAYDAISDDAAAHDAGTAALLLTPALPASEHPTIFVSVVSYRDPEAVVRPRPTPTLVVKLGDLNPGRFV